jgi:hypothetical protein
MTEMERWRRAGKLLARRAPELVNRLMAVFRKVLDGKYSLRE